MKKIIPIVIVVLLIVGAGAFYFLGGKNKNESAISETEGEVRVEVGKKDEEKTGEEKKGLLDFLKVSGGVSCSVEDEQGKYTVKSNGMKVRIEGIDYVGYGEQGATPEKGFMISDGTWLYMWGGKEGLKFNMKEMEQLSGETNQQESFGASDWTEWAKSMEESGAKYDCNPAVISDSEFMPPADIQFQDMGEMLKQFQNMGNNLQNTQIPSDIQIPENVQIPNIGQ